MILGINIQEPNNQFQLYLILGNQEKNNIMIPNTSKNMNIGKYNIVIVGDTINVTSYIVTKVLYQKGKEGKLSKVKRILTMINDISYSVGKTKKIIEQNTLINTDIIATSTTKQKKSEKKDKTQCNSKKTNQGRTLPEVLIYL